MKNKITAITVVAVAALFMGAGIYGGIITGNLGKIFMDTDPSSNEPTSGYIQKVGVTQALGAIKFNPSLEVNAVPEE